jgi:hypothetical protein
MKAGPNGPAFSMYIISEAPTHHQHHRANGTTASPSIRNDCAGALPRVNDVCEAVGRLLRPDVA